MDLFSWKSPFPDRETRVRAADVIEEYDFAQAIARSFMNTGEILHGNQLELERAFFRMQSGIPVVAVENEQIVAGGMVAITDEISACTKIGCIACYNRNGSRLKITAQRGTFRVSIGLRNSSIKEQFTDDF